jgi:hypothetical protein
MKRTMVIAIAALLFVLAAGHAHHAIVDGGSASLGASKH